MVLHRAPTLPLKAKPRALGALRSYFTRPRRRIYLAAELPTHRARARSLRSSGREPAAAARDM